MTLQLMGRMVSYIELNEFSFKSRAKENGVWSVELQGWFDPCALKIYVRKAMPEEQKRRVFLHELCHAVLSMSGMSEILKYKHEEAICTAMENLLPYFNSTLVLMKESEAE